MRRGDLVTVAAPGDYGKPRPALVIQADGFDQIGSSTVLLLSSTLIDAPLVRIDIEPTSETGLKSSSQVMVDKAVTVRRERVGSTIGRLDDETMLVVARSLAVFFGLA